MGVKVTTKDFWNIKSKLAKNWSAAAIELSTGWSEHTVRRVRTSVNYTAYKRRIYRETHPDGFIRTPRGPHKITAKRPSILNKIMNWRKT